MQRDIITHSRHPASIRHPFNSRYLHLYIMEGSSLPSILYIHVYCASVSLAPVVLRYTKAARRRLQLACVCLSDGVQAVQSFLFPFFSLSPPARPAVLFSAETRTCAPVRFVFYSRPPRAGPPVIRDVLRLSVLRI